MTELKALEELRKYELFDRGRQMSAYMPSDTIADAIQAEVDGLMAENERLRAESKRKSEQLAACQKALEERNSGELKKQWKKQLADLEAENEQLRADIEERYMLLPVDADGVPIHIGDNLYSDELRKQFPCRGYSLTPTQRNNKWWTVECSYDPYSGTSEYTAAKSCRHVKKRTVEDVLHDVMEAYAFDDDASIAEITAKYASELRMAGDAE